jgi:hypothetical protein
MDQETDEDYEFLELVDLVEMDRAYLDSAIEKFDETSFDSFAFCQILQQHALPFISFKVF